MSAESDLVFTGIDHKICLFDWTGEVAFDRSSLELRKIIFWSAWQDHVWLTVDVEMAVWVVEAAVVFYQAGLGLHVEVEPDGLLGELIKRPDILAANLAIEDDVDGTFSALFFVQKFEDLLGFLNITQHELPLQNPKEEKLHTVSKMMKGRYE